MHERKRKLYLWDMKQTKQSAGVYLIEGIGSPFIVRNTGTCWVAYDANKDEDCADSNNWGVSFPTRAALVKYAKNF